MTKIVHVVKVYEGYDVIKKIIDPSEDVAEMIAEGVRDLGYEADIIEVEIAE
jgi:hypothetical protein